MGYESRGEAVVRTLASHQWCLGSNPSSDYWVEFVVGSLLWSERFFSGYSGFPLFLKPTFPNSNLTRNAGWRTTLWMSYKALALRGKGKGFSPATMNVVPGYFHKKIKKKKNQKKSLAIWFPAYFLHLPSLPAEVLWGSFVTHSFGGKIAWLMNPKGCLRGG